MSVVRTSWSLDFHSANVTGVGREYGIRDLRQCVLYFRVIEPLFTPLSFTSSGVRGPAFPNFRRKPMACVILIIALSLNGVIIFASPSDGADAPNWTGLWKVVLTCSRSICPVNGYFDLVQSGNTITGRLNGVITLTSGTASGSTAVLAYDYGPATEFYRLTMSPDGEMFSGPTTTVSTSGATTDVGLLTGTRSGENTLSVSDVTPGTDALSADVKVNLKSASTNESDCDQKVTYDFTDTDLDSAKEIAPCQYRLTFDPPGTGVYHVGLKATNSSGTVIPLTVDQYGNTVDGKFTLIIDSCEDPNQDVADVDSLLNADDGTCDVMVGDWDSDATDLATQVIDDTDAESSLAITPVPIKSVDPSDWPNRGPDGSGSISGWVPTGSAFIVGAEETHSTGVKSAAALVQKVSVPGVPDVWVGAADGRVSDYDADPPAYVIAAHGMWYTGNGLVQVPQGDTITTYVPIGTSMGPALGYDIDVGNVHGADTRYIHAYKAGQLIPNFTFTNYPNTVATHVHAPTDPTTLSQFMPTSPQRIWISACAPIMIPTGKTFDKALTDLPVLAPGNTVPISYVNVAITSKGELQVLGANTK